MSGAPSAPTSSRRRPRARPARRNPRERLRPLPFSLGNAARSSEMQSAARNAWSAPRRGSQGLAPALAPSFFVSGKTLPEHERSRPDALAGVPRRSPSIGKRESPGPHPALAYSHRYVRFTAYRCGIDPCVNGNPAHSGTPGTSGSTASRRQRIFVAFRGTRGRSIVRITGVCYKHHFGVSPATKSGTVHPPHSCPSKSSDFPSIHRNYP